MLRRNNAGACFSDMIGILLALFMNRPEEAVPYLSEALFGSIATLLNTIIGQFWVFRSRGDWDSALAIVRWGLGILDNLTAGGKPDYFTKVYAELLALLAFAQAKAGRREEAAASLREAAEKAARFDSGPDYSVKTMRFVEHTEQFTLWDLLGTTAGGSIAALFRLLEDPAFCEQWEEVRGHAQ